MPGDPSWGPTSRCGSVLGGEPTASIGKLSVFVVFRKMDVNWQSAACGFFPSSASDRT